MCRVNCCGTAAERLEMLTENQRRALPLIIGMCIAFTAFMAMLCGGVGLATVAALECAPLWPVIIGVLVGASVAGIVIRHDLPIRLRQMK